MCAQSKQSTSGPREHVAGRVSRAHRPTTVLYRRGVLRAAAAARSSTVSACWAASRARPCRRFRPAPGGIRWASRPGQIAYGSREPRGMEGQRQARRRAGDHLLRRGPRTGPGGGAGHQAAHRPSRGRRGRARRRAPLGRAARGVGGHRGRSARTGRSCRRPSECPLDPSRAGQADRDPAPTTTTWWSSRTGSPRCAAPGTGRQARRPAGTGCRIAATQPLPRRAAGDGAASRAAATAGARWSASPPTTTPRSRA